MQLHGKFRQHTTSPRRPSTARLISTTVAAKFIMIRCKPVTQSYSLHEVAATALRTARKLPQATSTTQEIQIYKVLSTFPDPAEHQPISDVPVVQTVITLSATTAPDNFTGLQNTSRKHKTKSFCEEPRLKPRLSSHHAHNSGAG